MTDLTDQILRETTPDPLYFPLSPTLEELEVYADDLHYEGNQLTIEWATRELQTHQMSWVRQGLVADRVRRYRLYKKQHPDWNTFCREVMGKDGWQINKIIDAALATMVLVREGFGILPTCLSQAQELVRCCLKGEILLTDAWQGVLEHVPLPYCITRSRIGEALGFPHENNNIPKSQRDKLKWLADRDGVTLSEKIDQIIKDEENCYDDDDDEQLDESDSELSEDTEEQELWYQEMRQDVERHDNQIWLLAAIAKFFRPIPKSQFGWLKQVRCQV